MENTTSTNTGSPPPTFPPGRVGTGEASLPIALGLLLVSVITPIACARFGLLGLVLAPGVFAFAATWTMRPEWFCALVGVTYAAGQQVLEDITVGSLNGSQLLIVGTTAALVVRAVPYLRGGRLSALPRCTTPFIVFLVMATLGVALSPWRTVALASLAKLIACFTVFAFSALVARKRSALTTARFTLGVAAVTAACLSVSGDLTGAEAFTTNEGESRASGSFGSPVQVGNVCLLGLPVFLSTLLSTRLQWQRLACVVALGCVGLGVFSAFSRRAIVSGMVFLLLVLVRWQPERRLSALRRVLLVVATCLVLGFGVLAVDEQTLTGRLDDIPFFGDSEVELASSGSGRGRIWAAVVGDLATNDALQWLCGRGLHATTLATNRELGVPCNAHNSYLEVLYCLGVLGLVVFLWLSLAMLKDLLRVGRRGGPLGSEAQLWALFLVGTYLGVDLFGSSLYNVEARWFLFLMLGTLLGSRAPERHSRPT